MSYVCRRPLHLAYQTNNEQIRLLHCDRVDSLLHILPRLPHHWISAHYTRYSGGGLRLRKLPDRERWSMGLDESFLYGPI